MGPGIQGTKLSDAQTGSPPRFKAQGKQKADGTRNSKKKAASSERAAAGLQGAVLNDDSVDDSPTILQAKNSRDTEAAKRTGSSLGMRE